MITTIEGLLSKARKSPKFLHVCSRLYRFVRLICCWLENQLPGISEEAGFKVAIAWTEDLGFDPEVD